MNNIKLLNNIDKFECNDNEFSIASYNILAQCYLDQKIKEYTYNNNIDNIN
jgi:mRNA deadenylase 3'-5' endonuclease subunit Ccr4